MDDQLSRRSLIGRAGLLLGGAVALKVLPGCGAGDNNNPNPDAKATHDGGTGPSPDKGTNPCDAGTKPSPDAGSVGPQVGDFPYEKHLQASYRLDAAAVKEAAYHYYYAGGCCHGSYRALLEHLASTAGAPFNLLPLDFGKFGAGGIAGYGSICGAALGGVLIINTIVGDATARSALLTDLLRWYEGYAFPSYVPTTIDAAEKDLTKNFSAGTISSLQIVPHSHLCHASVSSWCAAMAVSAIGNDKKARCARLTADVAGKTAEMLNSYLASHAYTAAAIDTVSAGCVSCHAPASTTQPAATGMSCSSCHSDKLTSHP